VGYGPSGDDMRRMRGNSTANDLPGLTIDDPGNSNKGGRRGPDGPSEADPQTQKSNAEIVGALTKAIQEHPELLKQLQQEKEGQPQESITGGSGLAPKDEEHIGGKGHSRAI